MGPSTTSVHSFIELYSGFHRQVEDSNSPLMEQLSESAKRASCKVTGARLLVAAHSQLGGRFHRCPENESLTILGLH